MPATGIVEWRIGAGEQSSQTPISITPNLQQKRQVLLFQSKAPLQDIATINKLSPPDILTKPINASMFAGVVPLGENLLPEGKPNLSKLALYEELRDIYILGNQPIPFTKNPLKHSYISVCTSTRCLPSRKWQPTFDALKSAVENAGLDIEVRTSGCLEVCQQGPVVFYSDDRTWYTRVNSNIAEIIVNEHLIKGNKVIEHCYPPDSV